MYGGPSHVDTFDYKPKLYPLDGKTIAGQDLRPRRPQERGPRRRAQVEVPAVRPVRQVGQRPVPAPGHLRRRHRLPPLDVRRVADPRLGDADDELRPPPQRPSLPGHRGSTYGLGSVNENLPGFVVMLDQDRRPDQRRQELVERLHAGRLPGRLSFAPSGMPIHDLALPPGMTRPASGSCWTGCARRTRSTWLARRQLRAGGPHRQLRAGLQDAAARSRGGRFRPGIAGDAGAVRHRRAAHRRLRPQVPAGPPAGRARRALHPGLLAAAPTTTTTGTPTPTSSTTTPSTPATPTSRLPACSRT